jgi:hypothetical protein
MTTYNHATRQVHHAARRDSLSSSGGEGWGEEAVFSSLVRGSWGASTPNSACIETMNRGEQTDPCP